MRRVFYCLYIAYWRIGSSDLKSRCLFGRLGSLHMKNKSIACCLSVLILSGCFHKVKDVPEPNLSEYPKLLSAKANDREYVAAWQDLVSASGRCRVIHNNYEANAKNAEEAKLIIGAGGGIAGFTGTMLAAAGTGGAAAGIAAGLAGVASVVLGSSEKGPLGTAFYTSQKEGIARQIQQAADEAEKKTVPRDVYVIASSLTASCLAAESTAAPK